MNRGYWLVLGAAFLSLGALAGVSLPASAADGPPTVGGMQVTPDAKPAKKQPIHIKIDAPKLDLGMQDTHVSGLQSFSINNHFSGTTDAGTSSASSGAGRGPQISPVRPLHTPPPEYPRAEYRDAVSARIEIMYTVRADGTTGDLHIITPNAPEPFKEATRDAVARWTFHPATVDGQPQARRVKQTISFHPPQAALDAHRRAVAQAAQQHRAPPAPSGSGRGPSIHGSAPVPVHIVPPEYPAAAARRNTDGYVVVAFTVTADGSTSDIQVVSSSPRDIFDAAARAAVAHWRFQPYRIDGKPASVRVQQRIEFKR
ncbi:MAG TPA: energy transducer TonB [Gammaproteobacteria bacterium]|nr:energy transducer TonB [Gammaproteobacteria bacterium]